MTARQIKKFALGHYFLVEWKGEDSYTVLTGKQINQTKTTKDLSNLSVGDTVVAKWGTKEFEAIILKVGTESEVLAAQKELEESDEEVNHAFQDDEEKEKIDENGGRREEQHAKGENQPTEKATQHHEGQKMQVAEMKKGEQGKTLKGKRKTKQAKEKAEGTPTKKAKVISSPSDSKIVHKEVLEKQKRKEKARQEASAEIGNIIIDLAESAPIDRSTPVNSAGHDFACLSSPGDPALVCSTSELTPLCPTHDLTTSWSQGFQPGHDPTHLHSTHDLATIHTREVSPKYTPGPPIHSAHEFSPVYAHHSSRSPPEIVDQYGSWPAMLRGSAFSRSQTPYSDTSELHSEDVKHLTTLVFNLMHTMQTGFTTVNANVMSLQSELSGLKNDLKSDVRRRKSGEMSKLVRRYSGGDSTPTQSQNLQQLEDKKKGCWFGDPHKEQLRVWIDDVDASQLASVDTESDPGKLAQALLELLFPHEVLARGNATKPRKEGIEMLDSSKLHAIRVHINYRCNVGLLHSTQETKLWKAIRMEKLNSRCRQHRSALVKQETQQRADPED